MVDVPAKLMARVRVFDTGDARKTVLTAGHAWHWVDPFAGTARAASVLGGATAPARSPTSRPWRRSVTRVTLCRLSRGQGGCEQFHHGAWPCSTQRMGSASTR